MARKEKQSAARQPEAKQPKARLFYDPESLADAPEHHELARSFGVLTWDTWDHDVRPVAERVRDFLFAFPPRDPTGHMACGLVRKEDDSYGPALSEDLLARFQATDSRPGSLPELLARYGLKLRDGPQYTSRQTKLDPFVDVARRRNKKLRVLYGAVDQEPSDMDAAKADYLEKLQAAQEIRAARKRMKEDLRTETDAKNDEIQS